MFFVIFICIEIIMIVKVCGFCCLYVFGQKFFGLFCVVVFIVFVLMVIGWLLFFFWVVVIVFKIEMDVVFGDLGWIGVSGFIIEVFIVILLQGNVYMWVLNSLFMLVVIILIMLMILVLVVYVFFCLDFIGCKWLFVVIIVLIVVLLQVLIILLFYEMFVFNFVDMYWGLILLQVVVLVMVFILKWFFDVILIEFEDVVCVDGVGWLCIFWFIVFLLFCFILVFVVIFVFIGVWNNFFWLFFVINDIMLMMLLVGFQMVISVYGVQYVQVMVQVVFVVFLFIVIFIIFQKQIVKGVVISGFGGQQFLFGYRVRYKESNVLGLYYY